MVVTLSLDYRTLADKSHLIYIGLLGAPAVRAALRHRRRWARGAGSRCGRVNLQPSEFAKIGVALVLAKFFGENRGTAGLDRSCDRRRAHAPCRSRSSRRSPTSARRSRCCPCSGAVAYLAGHAHAHLRHPARGVRPRGPIAWKFALKDYQKIPHLHLPRPVTGRERRRVPADPGAHHRRVGRFDGQGLPAGHAGSAALPARRPQRFHLLGAGRGAGVRRRPGGARPVFVRDSALARGGPAGQGPRSGRTSCWVCSPASPSR